MTPVRRDGCGVPASPRMAALSAFTMSLTVRQSSSWRSTSLARALLESPRRKSTSVGYLLLRPGTSICFDGRRAMIAMRTQSVAKFTWCEQFDPTDLVCAARQSVASLALALWILWGGIAFVALIPSPFDPPVQEPLDHPWRPQDQPACGPQLPTSPLSPLHPSPPASLDTSNEGYCL